MTEVLKKGGKEGKGEFMIFIHEVSGDAILIIQEILGEMRFVTCANTRACWSI
jgi:hypothetical protein